MLAMNVDCWWQVNYLSPGLVERLEVAQVPEERLEEQISGVQRLQSGNCCPVVLEFWNGIFFSSQKSVDV